MNTQSNIKHLFAIIAIIGLQVSAAYAAREHTGRYRQDRARAIHSGFLMNTSERTTIGVEFTRHPEAGPRRGREWNAPTGRIKEYDLPVDRFDSGGLTDAFYTKLTRISAGLQVRPEDLLAVMYCESGLRASARNPRSGAAGLIQFLPGTLASIGFSGGADEFCLLTETEQLTWVEQFLSRYQRYGLDSAARIYQAVFMPGTLRDGSVVLLDSRIDPVRYQRNGVLDLDHDGVITVSDLAEFVARKCRKPAYQTSLRHLQQTQ